jgi:hypothetical protein
MGYLVSAPIPPIAIGVLRVEYENIGFWLAQLYGLPFLPVAEVTGSYSAGAIAYWIIAASFIALWIGSNRRSSQ